MLLKNDPSATFLNVVNLQEFMNDEKIPHKSNSRFSVSPIENPGGLTVMQNHVIKTSMSKATLPSNFGVFIFQN
jgi:hypothetical protein